MAGERSIGIRRVMEGVPFGYTDVIIGLLMELTYLGIVPYRLADIISSVISLISVFAEAGLKVIIRYDSRLEVESEMESPKARLASRVPGEEGLIIRTDVRGRLPSHLSFIAGLSEVQGSPLLLSFCEVPFYDEQSCLVVFVGHVQPAIVLL